MNTWQVFFYDEESKRIVEALQFQIERLKQEIESQQSAQWAMINGFRNDRLLGEARLSLDRIKLGEVQDMQAEAERGLNASMSPNYAPAPYNFVPYTEKIMENYARLVSAFQADIRKGYEELERQLTEGILPPTVDRVE